MPYSTILCATDGFEYSDRALQHAADVATDCGATLHVLHIVDPPLSWGVMGGEYIHLTPRERRRRIERHVARIEAGQDVPVTAHFLADGRGSTAAQIASIADTIAADVIVVGSRGMTPLGGALAGSVAQRLPHVTMRPILVVAGVPASQGLRIRRRPKVPPAIAPAARNGTR